MVKQSPPLRLIAPVILLLPLVLVAASPHTSSESRSAAVFSFPQHPASPQLSGHTEPEVKRFGSTYYLYYRTSSDDIAVATSPDGSTWSEHGIILTKGPIANLLPNGSVDHGSTGPDQWFHSASGTSWDAADAFSPTHSLKLTTSGGPADWRSATVNVSANHRYALTARIKGSISLGQVFLTVRWFPSHDGAHPIREDNLPLTGTHETWSNVSFTVKAPIEAAGADIQFRSANSTANINGDDFTFGASTWDFRYAISPSVETDGTHYYLFYEGNDGINSGIGYARASSPLGPFVKATANPILAHSGNGFESISVGTPAVLHLGDKWLLFYHGYNGSNDQIGLAWSTNLSTWTRSPHNPVLPNSAADWTSSFVAPSSAIVLCNDIYVFIEGVDHSGKWRIGAAEAPGDTIETVSLALQPMDPIFSASPTGWDNDWVQLPDVLLSPDNQALKLWYTGHNAQTNTLSLGYTTSSPLSCQTLPNG